ncbi:MAG: hypothetical protein KG029_07755 [Bacteroidetes bacterium]|nr:hypothetical protein [Bacteroidota bacterium]
MGRFFEAVDFLIEKEKLSGYQTYCRYYNIDKRNFYVQKKDNSRGYFQVSWMVPLVRYYGINPRWLLTGFGPMIKKRADKKEE